MKWDDIFNWVTVLVMFHFKYEWCEKVCEDNVEHSFFNKKMTLNSMVYNFFFLNGVVPNFIMQGLKNRRKDIETCLTVLSLGGLCDR